MRLYQAQHTSEDAILSLIILFFWGSSTGKFQDCLAGRQACARKFGGVSLIREVLQVVLLGEQGGGV